MSPSGPVPKSIHARHFIGWYSGWYGRYGTGPSHMSQSSVSGTGGVSLGCAICAKSDHGSPPTGRSVHAWTSVTLPMAPSSSHSFRIRIDSYEWPWLPICVTTLCRRAASVIVRASRIVWVSGFWQ